jgi:hypothetical protein
VPPGHGAAGSRCRRVGWPAGSGTRTLNPGESTIAVRAAPPYDLVMRLHESRDAGRPQKAASRGGNLPRLGGLLRVYFVLLAIFAVHNSVLTVGSIIVYAHARATGSHSHVPFGSLVFYIASNVALVLYVIYLFFLMSRRRKSAIINNVVFNILSIVFLVSWHAIGEKSNTGTIVDSVPNLLIAVYFLLSRGVRNTFVIDRYGRSIT